jgi:hypothetical protein
MNPGDLPRFGRLAFHSQFASTGDAICECATAGIAWWREANGPALCSQATPPRRHNCLNRSLFPLIYRKLRSPANVTDWAFF